MPPRAPRQVYEFGPFRLDTREKQLFRNGQTVSLTPKTLELLILLADNQGHLVEKEAVMASLWPDTFVEESNLTQHVSRLRKALGNGSGANEYIETIPRRGYRFIGSLSKTEAPPEVRTNRANRRWIVVGAATALLVVTATLTMTARTPREAPISDQAHEAYLKGRHHWNRRTVPDFQKAVDYFRAATEHDPRYAQAWAGLADSYNFLGQAPRARIAATRALEIDPTCAPAHAALGNAALFHDYDWVAADRAFHRAIELDPSYATAHHWRAFLLVSQRRFNEARQAIELARKLDPLSKAITTDVGMIQYYSGQYDRAIAHYRLALDLEPGFAQARHMLAWAYLRARRFEEAEALVASGSTPEFDATLLAARGERARALAILTRLEKELDHRHRGITDYALARAFVAAGDHARALLWLGRAHDTRDGDLAMLHVDPGFDPIRTDPAFAAFLRTRKLTAPEA